MENYKITIEDINSNYFHFTPKNNIDSIKSNGLVANIGKNARYIEKTKKIFFCRRIR